MTVHDVEGGSSGSDVPIAAGEQTHLTAYNQRTYSKDSEVQSVVSSSNASTKKMSNLRDSFINSVNTLLGVGVLSLPFAFAKGGWMTLPLTVFVSLWAGYTAYLLGLVQKEVIKVTAAAGDDPDVSGIYKRKRNKNGKTVNGRCFRKMVKDGERIWEVKWVPAASVDDTPGWKVYASDPQHGDESDAETVAESESVWSPQSTPADAPLVQQQAQLQVHRLDQYPEIGYAAFGKAGYITVQLLFYGELSLFAISMIVLAVSNLVFLTSTPSKLWLSVIYGAAAMPQGFIRDFSMLSFLSYFGFFAVLVVLASILYFGFSTSHAPGSILHPRDDLEIFKPCTFSQSFALIMGSLAGHSLFPALRADMSRPTRYPGVALLAFTICSLYYAMTGAFGYMMYGPDVKDIVTQNFDEDSPITTAIAVCIVAVCYSKHGLCTNVLSTSIENTLIRKGYKGSWYMYGPIRFTFTVVVVIISLLFPSFDKAMGLVGAAASAMVSLAFPMGAYVVLFYKDMGCLRLAINGLLLLLSFYFAVTGTLNTLGQDVC